MAKKKEAVKKPKKAPLGVQIISVLYYIGAVIITLVGLLCIVLGAGFADELITSMGSLGPGLIVALGIIFIAIGVFGFFVGMGLWKLKQWARIAVIVLSLISVISSLYGLVMMKSIVSNIITILINGAIAYYLIFVKEAKEAFK